MRNMRRTGFILCALLVILVIGVGPGLGLAAEVGVTDTTIKIGLISDMTGGASFIGRAVRDGWTLFMEEFNARGGVYGRKLEMVIGDQAASGSKGIAALKKLVEQDQVFMLYGGGASAGTIPLIPLINAYKIPFLCTLTTNPLLTSPVSRTIFRVTGAPDDVVTHAMVDFLWKGKGLRKIAILNMADEYGIGGAEGATARLKSYGAAPVAHETFNLGDTSFSSQILRLKAQAPDGVLVYGFVKEIAIILRQAKELGLETTFILSPGSGGALFVAVAQEHAVGAYVAWYVGPVFDSPTTPVVASFFERFKKRFSGYPAGIPNLFDMESYAGGLVLEEALKRAGRDLTREKLIGALESIRGFNAGGLINSVTFSPTDHQGTKTIRIYQILPGGKTEFSNFVYTPER